MRSTPIRCAVFDIDDTLYLERDYVRSGFRAVDEWALGNLGMSGFFEQAWSAFERGARNTVFNEVLRKLGAEPTEALIDTLVRTYRDHAPQIDLLADARHCLDRLAGHVAVGVVTDGPVASQRAKATALGLSRWSHVTVFTAELGDGFHKPHPRPFEVIERATGCAGAECLYVADNPVKDFQGPKHLGWKTVRVRRPASLHRNVPSDHYVDVEILDLWQLEAALRMPASLPRSDENEATRA